TELRFRTHPASAAILGRLEWPWSRAAAVVSGWQNWGPLLPDEIWSSLHLKARPGRTPVLSLVLFSLGPYGELENAVDRLADRSGAAPSRTSLRPVPYADGMLFYAGCQGRTAEQCHLPGRLPGSRPQGVLERETYAARSDLLDRPLDASGVGVLL
ncbi:hypothetical protein ACSNOD_31745, partial [Streptomyces sp. URMC 123]